MLDRQVLQPFQLDRVVFEVMSRGAIQTLDQHPALGGSLPVLTDHDRL